MAPGEGGPPVYYVVGKRSGIICPGNGCDIRSQVDLVGQKRLQLLLELIDQLLYICISGVKQAHFTLCRDIDDIIVIVVNGNGVWNVLCIDGF